MEPCLPPIEPCLPTIEPCFPAIEPSGGFHQSETLHSRADRGDIARRRREDCSRREGRCIRDKRERKNTLQHAWLRRVYKVKHCWRKVA